MEWQLPYENKYTTTPFLLFADTDDTFSLKKNQLYRTMLRIWKRPPKRGSQHSADSIPPSSSLFLSLPFFLTIKALSSFATSVRVARSGIEAHVYRSLHVSLDSGDERTKTYQNVVCFPHLSWTDFLVLVIAHFERFHDIFVLVSRSIQSLQQ